MVNPRLTRFAHIQPIAAHPKGHRREKGICRAKGRARQIWPAKARQPLGPKLANARHIPGQCVGHGLWLHADADIHRAVITQRRKARMHFNDGALRPSAGIRTLRPNLGKAVRKIKGNAQRVINRAASILQNRHLAGWRKGPKLGIIIRL